MKEKLLISFNPEEEWKSIPGYEGCYAVSSFGNVMSYARSGCGKRNKTVKQSWSSAKYQTVALSKDGSLKRYYVHRLVMIAFVPNPLNKPQVNHIDGDRRNNKLDNLEWVTGSENAIHALETGLKKYFGKGKPLSDQHKANISQSLKGRISPCGMKGKIMSEESRRKISINNKGISRNKGKIAYQYPIVQYDLTKRLIKEWPSATYAARELGLRQNYIVMCLRNKRNKTGGFKWEYKK